MESKTPIQLHEIKEDLSKHQKSKSKLKCSSENMAKDLESEILKQLQYPNCSCPPGFSASDPAESQLTAKPRSP